MRPESYGGFAMTLKEAAEAGIYRVTRASWLKVFPGAHFRLFVEVGADGPKIKETILYYCDTYIMRDNHFFRYRSKSLTSGDYLLYDGPIPAFLYPYSEE